MLCVYITDPPRLKSPSHRRQKQDVSI